MKDDTAEEFRREYIEYSAMEVTCGQNNIFVSAFASEQGFLNSCYDDNIECKELLLKLRKILIRDGSLLEFFDVQLTK